MKSKNHQLYEQAKQYIPGGVNSPVRAFNGVGGEPIFIEYADGPYLYDVESKRYIDYIGSWGPMILGHNDATVRKAVQQACEQGLSFGAPTEIEVEMAQTLCRLVPSLESVRMVNSGTEATMSAIRLARAYTKRDKILKFNGCYHGHGDSFLVKTGSGALTMGVPTSPGVPEDLAQHTLNAEYNDLAQVREIFALYGDEIAAIIVEPVAGNMNLIPPIEDFLQGLRDVCNEYDAVLIFDEVMTGFRVALGGAQALYGVTPDMTTLGKVIGGGMPVGAFGGKREIMEHIAPVGSTYQAGTLSGNPVAMAAGLANLQGLQTKDFYSNLTTQTETLVKGLQAAADKAGVPFFARSVGSMFGLFFTESNIINTFDDVSQCDVEKFKHFFHAMLDNGVMLAPSAYEAGFVSAMHDQAVIEETVEAAKLSFAQ